MWINVMLPWTLPRWFQFSVIAVSDAWDESFFSGLVKNDDRDGDGYSNGTEVQTGSDPLDALSPRTL